jgi:hypothetical protein
VSTKANGVGVAAIKKNWLEHLHLHEFDQAGNASLVTDLYLRVVDDDAVISAASQHHDFLEP